MSDENIIRSLADGILNLGDTKIDVAVLEDGTRIITHSGVFRALGREPRGKRKARSNPCIYGCKKPAKLD